MKELYIRFMIWLGAEPPAGYEDLTAEDQPTPSSLRPGRRRRSWVPLLTGLGVAVLCGLVLFLCRLVYPIPGPEVSPPTPFPTPSGEVGLRGADLTGQDLSGVDLSGQDLSGTNLSDTNLSGADLSGADLSGANLSGADLSEADLSGADLTESNLSETNLSEANLSEVTLANTNLEETNLTGADLTAADLQVEEPATAEIGPADKVGQIDVSYPYRMWPNSGGSVRVSIAAILADLSSVDTRNFERIPIPPDAEPIIDEYGSYLANIFIRERMWVELDSTSDFEIRNILPLTQTVNLESGITDWAWSIIAPATAGSHELVVSVYREGVSLPWVRSFQVLVGEPTPTPVPTSTPTPTPTRLEQVGDRLTERSVDIFMMLVPMLIGGIAFVFQTHRARQNEIKSLKREMKEATTGQAELEQEITELQAIKWWQFWK